MRKIIVATLLLLAAAAWARTEILGEVAAAAAETAREKVAAVEADEGGVAVTNWTDGYVEVTAVG
ncbi:MAG: hypothetical protein JSU81_07635, partial [Candidatus Coatesbacteria bacterium]